jgi:hypothetical protein
MNLRSRCITTLPETFLQKTKRLSAFSFFFLFIFCVGIKTLNAQRYWISSTTGNWSNPSNWSTTSGGTPGAGAPTTANNAIFDGNGTGNCIINANASANNLVVQAGYTGVITQTTGVTLTINNGSTWTGGTFIGGNSSITNNGAFSLQGTNFTSTSGTLSIRNTCNFTSGTFNHNNGSVSFANNSFAVSGSPTFNNLYFTPNYNAITVNNSFTVNGNLYLDGVAAYVTVTTASGVTLTVNGNVYKTGSNNTQFNVGTIDAKGDIIYTSTSGGSGGSGSYIISGVGNQVLSSTAPAYQGRIHNVTINKPSGQLGLSGIITVGGPNWTFQSGTLSAGTSTIVFYREPGGSNLLISGTHTLNDVMVYPYYNTTTVTGNLSVNSLTLDGSAASDVLLNNTVTVNGNLYTTGTDQINIDGGLMKVYGNISISNTAFGAGGDGTVQVAGTANQTFSSTSALSRGVFPNIIINKPSGTLTLSGNISTSGPNWSYVSGSLDPANSTVYFYTNPGGPSINISGTHTLNNVYVYPYYSTTTITGNLSVNSLTLDGASSSYFTINSSLDVNGNLSLIGADDIVLNTGTVNVMGDIINTNTDNASGGTAAFIINGTGNQTIRGNGIANQSKLPSNVILNKPSGNLSIGGGVPYYFHNTLNFTQGTIIATSSQVLIFPSGSAVTGTPSNSCYVEGPVRKIGNTAFTFPIGGNGYYAPIGISAPSAASAAFTAEYFNTDPDLFYDVTLKDASLNHISRCEYWDLERTSGTSNVSVTVSWDSPRTCSVNNISDLRVAHWDDNLATPIWKDMGNGTTLGNTTTGTIKTSVLVTSFSPFTLASATSSNPLPVELTMFEGRCTHDGVLIQWQTASEKNCESFDIERSGDGITWSSIGTKKGAGTNEGISDYSFTDDEKNDGLVYYRLKQKDFNRDFKYSKVIASNCKNITSVLFIFPNPGTGKFSFQYNGQQNSQLLEIVDVLGNAIYSGKFIPDLDLSERSAGVYFLNLYLSSGERLIKKIILEK